MVEGFCFDCVSFYPIAEEHRRDSSYTGSCRRFPPTVPYSHYVNVEVQDRCFFPRVSDGDWCREWESAEEG